MRAFRTEHARKRMQQRAISDLMVRLIEEFGVEIAQKHGSVARFLPEEQIRNLRTAIDRLSDVRVIESEAGHLITVMHGTERLKRPA